MLCHRHGFLTKKEFYMDRLFTSWIGFNDLKAEKSESQGSILSCLLNAELAYNKILLLTTNDDLSVMHYVKWLQTQLLVQKRYKHSKVKVIELEVVSPIDYFSIYSRVSEFLEFVTQQSSFITVGVSSGTPAMATVWLLLAKGVYNLNCIQSSRENGVQEIHLPFDLSLHYLEVQDSSLKHLMSRNELNTSFNHLISNSSEMKKLIELSSRIAIRGVPVIIQGPTGSGKEVLAKAIHNSSTRSESQLVVVNCGAIPENLIESALFGHKKGAFTGAISDKKGYFSEADKGTLFLDEVAELSLSAQVQLLRAIQEGEIQRVGEDKLTKVNVRVIAATHKDLLNMVDNGSFREDLFYRLAVGVLQIPSLCQRKEDIIPLAELLMNEINQEANDQPGYKKKKLSKEAKQLIYGYHWPGNVRELRTTLLRASVWSENEILEEYDIKQGIIWRNPEKISDKTKYIPPEFNLNDHVLSIKKEFIEQALIQSKFRKKEAAEMLGLGNHQTLTNWAKKVGLDI